MSFLELLSTRNPWWSDPSARLDAPERHRHAYAGLHEALADPTTRRAQLLVGPRQVGKSVLLRQIARAFLDAGWPAPNVLYYDFKDDRVEQDHTVAEVVDAKPGGFREDHPRLLLLDEITGAPRWDLALKRIVDDSRLAGARGARVLATDSAALLMRKGTRESLQGRVDETRIHGVTFAEGLALQSARHETPRDVLLRVPGVFDRYLQRGGLPEHLMSDNLERTRERMRQDVVDRAIARDMGREHGIDVERAAALFRHIVQESGSLFEPGNRAKDLQSPGGKGPDLRAVRRWARLLEQALLVAGLEPWHPGLRRGINRPSRALKARRKLYAEDHGFIPAFSPFASPMSRDGVRARVFETVVFTHLRALRESRHDFGLYYFRERDTTEMDFVLDFEDAALGVEVTSGKTPQKKVASASRAAARAGLDRVILVHGGPLSRQDFDGGTALPLDAFLLDPRAAVEDALEWVRRSR